MENEKNIKISLNRKLGKGESENIKKLAERIIDYLSRESGAKKGLTGFSFKGAENRAIYYTYPKQAIFNKPLNLADEPPPVGTTGLTTAV